MNPVQAATVLHTGIRASYLDMYPIVQRESVAKLSGDYYVITPKPYTVDPAILEHPIVQQIELPWSWDLLDPPPTPFVAFKAPNPGDGPGDFACYCPEIVGFNLRANLELKPVGDSGMKLYVPREFGQAVPVIQCIANTQYSIDRDAKSRGALLTLRQSWVHPGQSQVSIMPHIDKKGELGKLVTAYLIANCFLPVFFLNPFRELREDLHVYQIEQQADPEQTWSPEPNEGVLFNGAGPHAGILAPLGGESLLRIFLRVIFYRR